MDPMDLIPDKYSRNYKMNEISGSWSFVWDEEVSVRVHVASLWLVAYLGYVSICKRLISVDLKGWARGKGTASLQAKSFEIPKFRRALLRDISKSQEPAGSAGE